MKRERSTAYPVLDLATAYRILRQDLAGLGTAELDRDDIARKLGYQAAWGGLAARKIGALVHYGLLNRRASRYGLSPLGLRLQNLDLGDPEFSSAICAALEHPTLFKALLGRYRELGRLPTNFAQELAKFGITERASADVAAVFRDSALFAGVLDTDELFRSKAMRSTPVSPALKPPQEQESLPEKGRLQESSEDWYEFPLLLSNGKTGYLMLPTRMEPDDLVALKDALGSIRKRLPMHLGAGVQPARGETNTAASKPPLKFQRRRKKNI
jgi:hypothetical protein